MKPVLVHLCFDPSAGEKKPEFCTCSHHVTKRERDERLHANVAFPIKDSSGKIVQLEIVQLRISHIERPRAITKADIEAAYIAQNKNAKHRIEIYGHVGNFARI